MSLTVDQHIAKAVEFQVLSGNGAGTVEWRASVCAQATAHAAIATALLARYPGWGECGVLKGDYNGTQDYDRLL